jgi:CrcB protein
MKQVLLVGTGSFLGGIARYLVSQLVREKFLSLFPYGTLAVNITGCLLIGIVFGYSEKAMVNPDWKIFLATGLLGGFTTFSAFSNESLSLMRMGNTYAAFIYIGTSVVLGILATFMGFSLMKLF